MSRTTTYVREEEEIDSRDVIVGAYLRSARTFQDVPTWHMTTDIDDLLRHDHGEVVYGNEEQIETEIHKRHPIDGEGLTYVLKSVRGHEIERYPRLMVADLALLQAGCGLHKKVLVGHEIVKELGGQKHLVDQGFILTSRPTRFAELVSYNPMAVVVKKWRRQAADLKQYLEPEFPPALMGQLREFLDPEHWDGDHPFGGLIKATVGLTDSRVEDGGRRHGWRRRHHVLCNASEAPATAMRLLDLARRLSKREHKNPWRGGQWNHFLQEISPYVRGVLQNGDEDWKKLAQWIKTECRVTKVKIPPKVKLPARPRVKKKTALLMLTQMNGAAKGTP
jgi:hypothetical protein